MSFAQILCQKNTAIHWGGNATTYPPPTIWWPAVPTNAAIAELIPEPIPPLAAPCQKLSPWAKSNSPLCHSMCASSQNSWPKPQRLQILPPTPALTAAPIAPHNAALSALSKNWDQRKYWPIRCLKSQLLLPIATTASNGRSPQDRCNLLGGCS